MAKSKVQFQKGYSLFEFLKDYGSEAQCEKRCSPGVFHTVSSVLSVPIRPFAS